MATRQLESKYHFIIKAKKPQVCESLGCQCRCKLLGLACPSTMNLVCFFMAVVMELTNFSLPLDSYLILKTSLIFHN